MSRKSYSNDLKLKIVQMHKNGLSQKDISVQLTINKSVICRIIKRYRERGSVNTAPRSGRPRKITQKNENRILRLIKSDPFMSASTIINELNLEVSSRTVQRQLVKNRLLTRRPAKKPLLSKKNRMARLAFARKHINWDVKKWKTVLFSDESKFNLVDSDGMCHVRRPEGKRFDPRYYRTTVKHDNREGWQCFSMGMLLWK